MLFERQQQQRQRKLKGNNILNVTVNDTTSGHTSLPNESLEGSMSSSSSSKKDNKENDSTYANIYGKVDGYNYDDFGMDEHDGIFKTVEKKNKKNQCKINEKN